MLVNRLEKAKERLDDALETLHQLCEPVEQPKQLEQYIKYFCKDTNSKEALKETEELRLPFYKAVVALIRAYNNVAAEMKEAGYADKDAEQIKKKVDEYTELRNAIKIASADYIDLKKYEPDMRQLLDMYLSADPSRTLSNFGDATLLQLIVENGIEDATGKLPASIRRNPAAMAETLEANMRKVITQEMPINPVYYEKMSVLLTELVRQRKLGALSYEEYLKKIEELAKDIQPTASAKHPAAVDTGAKRALYDNLAENEQLALELFNAVNENRPDNWIGTPIKEKAVRIIVRKILNKYGVLDEAEVSRIYEIVENQEEFK